MRDISKHYPRLKIGFIGGGINSAVGETHKIASQMDGSFELVSGFFSREAQTNKITADDWGVSLDRAYSSLAEFLEAERKMLDAVVVLTPTPMHKDVVISCIEQQLPVICEKALAGSICEVEEIRTALNSHQGTLLVTFNYCGYPMIRELRQRIAQQEFGVIRQIMIEMPQEGFLRHTAEGESPRPQNWRQHDGVIPTVSLDLGVHVHQMVDFLIGEKALDVYATHHTFGEVPHVIDTVHCISNYTNEIVCNYWYSKAALGYRNGLKIRVFGSKGSAEWIQMNPEHLHISNISGSSWTVDRTHPDNIVANQARYSRFKAGHPAGFIEAFANSYEDIAASLRGECNSDVFGIDVAYQGLDFLSKVNTSAIKGCKVKI
ncbi:Gfo/Idh/MocA family oxidoreductase [Pectobacteriaceae bacterium CE90]|nr:Gfo/Idh/MocA family oxidoreductase [Pectobacteriaceae bacterium CE90]